MIRKAAGSIIRYCLVAGAVIAAVMQSSRSGETVQEQRLAAIKVSGGMDTAARETVLPVEDRIAVYEQIYAGSSAAIDTPESPDSTEKLLPFVGDVYIRYGGSSWYRVKGMDGEYHGGTVHEQQYRFRKTDPGTGRYAHLL